jgi:hypothetical protein
VQLNGSSVASYFYTVPASASSVAAWSSNSPAFTLTATVTPTSAETTTDGAFPVSAGSVTFYDSGTPIGKQTNQSSPGVYKLLSSAFTTGTPSPLGKHYYTASYGGVYSSGTAEFASSVSAATGVAINGPTTLIITATAPSATIAYGLSLPTITQSYSVTGGSWYGSDSPSNVSSMTTAPTCTTGYTPSSPVASTPTINCANAKDANYSISYTPSTVITVVRATATISHWYNQSTVYGTPIILSATTNSTGALTYAVVSGPATLSTLGGVTR